MISSSSWKRRVSLMARLYPTLRPARSPVELFQRSRHLGLHLERLETLADAPFVACHHELADLLGDAGLEPSRLRGSEQAGDLGVDVERRLPRTDEPLRAGAQHLANLQLALGAPGESVDPRPGRRRGEPHLAR